jgi:hypothetical protein
MGGRSLLWNHVKLLGHIRTRVALYLHGAPGTYSIALRGGWWCIAAVDMLLVWLTATLHASTHLSNVNGHKDVIMVCDRRFSHHGEQLDLSGSKDTQQVTSEESEPAEAMIPQFVI